jgi:DNA-binding CsgD family transcriptional regulator
MLSSTTIGIDVLMLVLILACLAVLVTVGFIHFLNVKRDKEKQQFEIQSLRNEKLMNEKLMNYVMLTKHHDKINPPQPYISQEVKSNHIDEDKLMLLTKREIEMIRWEANGLSAKDIADKLSISVNTVNNHFANIKAKTGIGNKAQRIQFAIKNNLV